MTHRGNDGTAESTRQRLEALLAQHPSVESWHPLSVGQQALWFLNEVEPGNPAYQLVTALWMSDPVDRDRLNAALARLCHLHPALRTGFPAHRRRPLAVVERAVPLTALFLPCPDDSDADLVERAIADASRPFDIAQPPLVRAAVYTGASGRPLLAITAHHLVMDLASARVLLADLVAGYANPAAPLPVASVSYAEAVAWQRAQRDSSSWSTSLEYLKRHLSGVRDTKVPADLASPRRQSFEGRTVSVVLCADLAASLRRGAHTHGIVLNTWFLAAWMATLRSYSDSDTVAVGVPVDNRPGPAFSRTVGFFANTVPVVGYLPDAMPFVAAARVVRSALLDALDHASVPYATVVQELALPRDPARAPLLQVGYVWSEAEHSETAPAVRPVISQHCGAPFELMLTVHDGVTDLELSLTYASALFSPSRARDILDRISVVLAASAAAPQTPVAALAVPSEPAVTSPAATLVDLIGERARATPTSIAVEVGDQRLTYADLWSRSGAIASGLAEAGTVRGDLVGVALRRSVMLLPAILGVLRAGAGYVPLDLTTPANRLRDMADDAGLATIVVDPTTERWLSGLGAKLLDVERLADTEPSPTVPPTLDDVAYVLYTSGSNGRPKGVVVEHRSVAALLDWAKRWYTADELSRVLAATPVSFDISIFELFAPLVTSGTVVVVDDLRRLGPHHRAGLINTVPSLLADLLRTSELPASVKVVNVAGEPLSRALVNEIYRAGTVRRVCNLYGPTETTVFSTAADIPAGGLGKPSIGAPIDDDEVLLLDAELRPVADGEPGELCITGVKLARGYLNQPALTRAAFVAHPTRVGSRLYRTGDLARWQPDGTLEYLGRLDDQTKIRGVRIEPGEVEQVLRDDPMVADAVVIAEGTEPSLVAYVVPRVGTEIDTAVLHARLARTLPNPMIPARFEAVRRFPRLPNGKVDRQVLRSDRVPLIGPAPAIVHPPRPMTCTEQMVSRAWSGVLGRAPAGIDENFFDVGGASIQSLEVIARIGAEIGADIRPEYVFAYPTIREFAALLDDLAAAAGPTTTDPGPDGRL